MKKAAVVFALMSCAALASAQNWLPGSLDDALARAKAEGKPLLLDFFAETG